MKTDDEQLCRLCLKVSDTGFETVEGVTLEALNFVLPDLDLSICNDAILCGNCSDNLKRCFNFKRKCLRVINTANLSLKVEDDVKLNIPKACLNGELNTNVTDICSDDNVCIFCMEAIKEESFMLFKNDVANVRAMLEKYFSELNLNVTAESVACKPCYESLQHLCSFMSDCLNMEKKIMEYCKVEGADSKCRIELNNTLDFTSKNEVYNKNGEGDLKDIKAEEHYEDVKNNISDVDVKSECMIKVEKLGHDVKRDDVKIEMEENDCDRYQHCQQPEEKPVVTPNKSSATKIYKCKVCAYQTKHRRALRAHTLVHKDPSEVRMYKCNICIYQTKRKNNLQKHVLTHKSSAEIPMYKCNGCKFQTKYQGNIQRHMLTHKNTSEVKMYECELCVHQDKRKDNLQKHMLVHSSCSEVTTYTCEMSTPQTRHKSNLVRLYECEICSFHTKHSGSFRRHMLTHKHPAEITIYKCSLCTYQGKHKNQLSNHMLIHKKVSEVTMYECKQCEFKTKYKKNLLRHTLSHKDATEVTIYKCEMCTYWTKHKDKLLKHLRTHKSASEVTMFKCEVCTYQSSRKDALRRHVLTHKSSSGVTKCEMDALQTSKHKSNRQLQVQAHKNSSDIKPFKCEICSFCTKHKKSLSRHMLSHKSPSEITMYKCNTCTYQNKRKDALLQHVRTHKSTSEVSAQM